MVLRYSGASMAAAVMIASLETHVGARASRSISNVTYVWDCDNTTDNHNLDLFQISTPIASGKGVAEEGRKTHEKIATTHIADSCFGIYPCDVSKPDLSFTMPRCRDCCEKRWAFFGNEFVEALDGSALSGRWARNIAPCAFVAGSKDEKPRPAKGAAELSWPQIKALSDLYRINGEVSKQADFSELDDVLEERILEKAAVVFAETFLRVKHNDLAWLGEQNLIEEPEQRCSMFYNMEFPPIQRPSPIRRDHSGTVEEPFISPRFSTTPRKGGGKLLQSSLAFLWETGPSGKMDHGASSRQQDLLSDDHSTQ